jgi:anthranilate synthase/aminodeoxychorismate synthase-like glutamine amidotransferase
MHSSRKRAPAEPRSDRTDESDREDEMSWQAGSVSSPRVVVIDNYDSFVYNLVQYLGQLGADPVVIRNDERDVASVLATTPDAILVSPGPGHPGDAGITCDLIARAVGQLPILGVCLGHQAIGHVFGARIARAPELRHGKTSTITHDGAGVFTSLPSPMEVTRYHSLVVEESGLPECLVATARAEDGTIMGVRHRYHDVEGVQFHPESILTQHGHAMLQNFLSRCSNN